MGQTLLGSFFRKKRRSPAELAKFLAEAYRGAFGADKFHALFDATSLNPSQDADLALAEWHAFGTFVFTYSLWVVYNSPSMLSPMLGSFRPALLSSLRLNEACEKRLLEIASDREKDYIAHFRRVKEGKDLACFFSRAVARITGGFSSEPDMQGIPQGGDIAVVTSLAGCVMEVMRHTKSAIEKLDPKRSQARVG
ncbi:MAG: hypothetical protein ACRD2P_02380 [Terriglobia bacterium]